MAIAFAIDGITPPVSVAAPWCDAAEVATRPGCSTIDPTILDQAALAASEILYGLSGRQFSGGPVTATVRPTARPYGWDALTWGRAAPFGWYGSWGTCCGYGSAYGYAAAVGRLGRCCEPPEIELGGYPILTIDQVKIDGQIIPADEYRVDDYRLLVRVRPTATSTPTVRAGWPTCQRLDLPDTEPGTFSVTFAYGTPPPAAGIRAARVLAAEIAKDEAGLSSQLPQRLRSITRQGESMVLIDPQEVLDKGRTGIPAVDLFLKAVNPQAMQRRAQAWSPDTGRARRTTWSAT